MGQALVIATIGLVLAIIAEATCSFLGVGVPPATPSLGTLIRNGNPRPPRTRLLLETITGGLPPACLGCVGALEMSSLWLRGR